MKIEDEFRVNVPIEEAWGVLLDVERIAPCMPGAQLQEVEGNEYRGIVKVKVGPITAQYKGAAHIVEADEATRKVVIKAEGRDTRGQGNASATVTATLAPDGDGTTVKIDTDLNVTGKVAQFGRGVMADVSSKLLKQFVASLEQDVLSGTPSASAKAAAEPAAAPGPSAPGAGASGAGETAETAAAAATATVEAPAAAPASNASNGSSAASDTGVRRVEHPEAEAVDLIEAAGGPVAKRLVPTLIGLGILALVIWLLRRDRHRR